jgi:hypothetical protein
MHLTLRRNKKFVKVLEISKYTYIFSLTSYIPIKNTIPPEGYFRQTLRGKLFGGRENWTEDEKASGVEVEDSKRNTALYGVFIF